MARKQKLKVYRTPIGFHDAYVAASSQKAALEAWGADVDLFARGVAEAATDEKLTSAPLESPGTIVRVPRGSSAEHMAALPKDKPARRKSPPSTEDEGPPPRRNAKSGTRPKRRAAEQKGERSTQRPEPTPKPKPRSKPRPSRERLDDAEQALERAEAEHKDAIAEIREQERELQRRRRDLETRHEEEVAKLEAAIGKARDGYAAALEKWRA